MLCLAADSFKDTLVTNRKPETVMHLTTYKTQSVLASMAGGKNYVRVKHLISSFE